MTNSSNRRFVVAGIEMSFSSTSKLVEYIEREKRALIRREHEAVVLKVPLKDHLTDIERRASNLAELLVHLDQWIVEELGKVEDEICFLKKLILDLDSSNL